MKDNFEMV